MNLQVGFRDESSDFRVQGVVDLECRSVGFVQHAFGPQATVVLFWSRVEVVWLQVDVEFTRFLRM